MQTEFERVRHPEIPLTPNLYNEQTKKNPTIFLKKISFQILTCSLSHFNRTMPPSYILTRQASFGPWETSSQRITGGPPSSPLNSSDSSVAVIPLRGESPSLFQTQQSLRHPASDLNTIWEFKMKPERKRRERIRGVWYLFDRYMSL